MSLLKHGVFVLAFVFCSSLALAQHEMHSAKATDLGDVRFVNSGSPEAQEPFIRGLLLLHSFEYPSAAAEFAKAQKIDPGFAMAYWGEAMTYNHPLWGEQDMAAARAALERLGASAEARAAKAPTEREKLYLRAVETLYGSGTKQERDARYSSVMKEVAAAYPEDLDGRAFYALSLLGVSGEVRDTAKYMRAAAVAEEIYEQDKRHPGALHYLIHAYDDPIHAPLGLRAARLYAKVAPAASHAQHMPSHIFFALGMWDDAISSNIDALGTAHAHGAGGYHPLHWLEYAYLQKKNLPEAEKLLRRVDEDVRKGANPYSLSHQAMVRATWLVETGGAAPAEALQRVDRGSIVSIGPFVGHELAIGLVALQKGDVDTAVDAQKRIGQFIESGRAKVKESGSTGSRYDNVGETELKYAEIMRLELQAAIEMQRGRAADALRTAESAAVMEDGTAFEFGPPSSVKPPWELVADLLLRAGRPAEAAAKYQQSMERYPNRRLSLEGLEKARAAKK